MKFKDTKYGDLTGQIYKGDIDVGQENLTSLEGAPERVQGNFYCFDNDLTSLEYAPKEVTGSFDCNNNNLTSLKGAPEVVGHNFYCTHNYLTSLEHAPKEVGSFFNCSYNKLTSAKGAPTVPVINRTFVFHGNPNKHLEQEWRLRCENPNFTEEQINEKMIEQGFYDYYLSEDAQEIFIF